MFPNIKAFGVNAIIRNNNGEFVAGLNEKFIIFSDPTTAEAFGALPKVLFGVHCDVKHAFIEGDALSIINAIKSPGFCRAPFWHIIEDVKRFSNHFRSCNWGFVRHCGNEVAHALETFAKLVFDCSICN